MPIQEIFVKLSGKTYIAHCEFNPAMPYADFSVTELYRHEHQILGDCDLWPIMDEGDKAEVTKQAQDYAICQYECEMEAQS